MRIASKYITAYAFFLSFLMNVIRLHPCHAQEVEPVSERLWNLMDKEKSLIEKKERLEEKIDDAEFDDKENRAKRLKNDLNKLQEESVSIWWEIIRDYENKRVYTDALDNLKWEEKITNKEADSILRQRDFKIINRKDVVNSELSDAFNRLAKYEYKRKNYIQAINYIDKSNQYYSSFCGNAHADKDEGVELFKARCYAELGNIDTSVYITERFLRGNRFRDRASDNTIELYAQLLLRKYGKDKIRKILTQNINKDPELYLYQKGKVILCLETTDIILDDFIQDDYYGWTYGKYDQLKSKEITQQQYIASFIEKFKETQLYKKLMNELVR